MCPSTPQWKINRGSSKSSDYFSAIYSVIFFNPLFHESEGILDKIFIKKWSRWIQASKNMVLKIQKPWGKETKANHHIYYFWILIISWTNLT